MISAIPHHLNSILDVRMDAFKFLLAQDGIDVNLQIRDGDTALMSAASRGNLDMTIILLDEHGVDTSLVSNRAPETPAPETPVPETPAPETPASEPDSTPEAPDCSNCKGSTSDTCLVIQGHRLSCVELNKGETYDIKYAEYDTVKTCRAQIKGPLEDHSNSTKDDASSLGTGEVIGIVLALVFVTMGMIAMVVVWRKGRSDERKRRDIRDFSVALPPLSQMENSVDHPSMVSNAATCGMMSACGAETEISLNLLFRRTSLQQSPPASIPSVSIPRFPSPLVPILKIIFRTSKCTLVLPT